MAVIGKVVHQAVRLRIMASLPTLDVKGQARIAPPPARRRWTRLRQPLLFAHAYPDSLWPFGA